MAERVKLKRPYESPRRREQAAATRLEILDAAQRLFERDGYPATTMAAISTDARVALKTVYVAFQTKSGLLRALWNARLRGGREDVPVAQLEIYRAVLEEPDPERQLRLNARNSREGKLRIAALAEVIRSAAPLDADIAELWSRIGIEYHANQRAIVDSIDQKAALKPDLDIDRAADILWTINHPNTWQLLVTQRGWTPEQYEQWTTDTAITQLLKPQPAERASTPKRVSTRAKKRT
jgi:AcrR family transcriptional regulator